MPQHLKLFLKALLFLFVVAFLGKTAFALYHRELFASLSLGDTAYALLWGFRFDLALAAAFALLAYLGAYLVHRLAGRSFAAALRHLCFLAAALIVILHGADALYYGEAGRHLGYELKEFYNSREALVSSAAGSYRVPVALYLLAIVPLFFTARWWLAGTRAHTARPRGLKRLAPELQLFSVILISGLAVRGGLQQVPIEPLHAQQIGDSRQATLALDGAYNALFSSTTPYAITPLLNKPATEAQVALVRQMYADSPSGHQPRRTTQPNVVMVFLESWSAAYMHAYGYDTVSTPFFDELRSRSLTTRGMLAGGHRTTEGLFATLCSAQNPLGQTVAQTQLQNYNYYCLPHQLRDQGYYSAFFQGTKKNTSGTGAFAQLLGFQDSYGIEDADGSPRHAPNSWGLHDPDLYEMVLKRLVSAPKPVLIGINTNSTHDSELPAGVTPYSQGDTPTADYLNVLHFADASLAEFMRKLYALPGMENTVLVLVADHAGPPLDTPYTMFLVPFLIYGPQVPAHEVPTVATQRDIAPTLGQLLGLDTPRWYMGHSLLHPDAAAHHFADFYYQGELGWVEGNQLVIQHLGGSSADTCHAIDTLIKPSSASCTEQHASLARRAMAFTTVAQQHLFGGQLKDFPAP